MLTFVCPINIEGKSIYAVETPLNHIFTPIGNSTK